MQDGGVLVVTDRYPPNSVGGAELSLQIVLREVARYERVTIAVIGGVGDARREEMRHGTRIVFLPKRAPWPFSHWSRTKFEQVLRAAAPVRIASLSIASLRFLVRRPLGRLPKRARALAFWLLYRTSLPSSTDLLIAEENHGNDALAALIRQLRPRLIHADNHDAILAVAEISDIPLVGFVRDNRFFCGRQDDAAAFDNRQCTQCVVACLPGAGVGASFNRTLIQRTALFRQKKLSAMTLIVVASRYLERQLGSPALRDRLRVVVNPVDIDLKSEKGVAPSGSKVDVAVVGSLTMKKGQVALLRRLPEMLCLIPNLHLHFLGAGPDEGKLREIAAEYGASGRVTLYGNLPPEAVAGVLASCSIVAIPSLWAEPFGRVAIEAAAMSVPAVAFASGGLPELVQSGVTGYLAPLGNFDEFIRSLGRLAADPGLRRQMGLAAKQAVSKAHGPEQVAAQLQMVWREAEDTFQKL